MLYGPRDIRVEDRPEPQIIKPTDGHHQNGGKLRVRVRSMALPRHRTVRPADPYGHEYCGIVEEVGTGVWSIKRGQFVIGSFFASDNACPNCQAGYQSSCQHRGGRWRRSYHRDEPS